MNPADPTRPAPMGQLKTGHRNRRAQLGEELTARETQVLQGMSYGRTNGEIGRRMGLTEDAIKTHASRLFRKLGARDRAHAVRLGFQAGLLVPDVPAARVAS